MTIKKNSLLKEKHCIIAFLILQLVLVSTRSMSQGPYVLSCNQPTDICNTVWPPELTVTPAGASLYEFYIYDDFYGIYTLMGSGPNNVLPINFSSSQYYCEVTDSLGTSQTNYIQMRCIYPAHWYIHSTAASSIVCGGATLTMKPSVWDSYQWYRDGIPVSGATSASYYATQPGNYNCYVTNSCGGDTAAIGRLIYSVDPVLPANPVITVTPGNSLCVGKPVTLIAPSVPGCTYTWYRYLQTGFTLNLPSGIDVDTLTLGSLSGTASERYRVEMHNQCGTKSSIVTAVFWTQIINASLTASGPLQFCPGGNVILSATQNNAWNYQWIKNNVSINGATQNTYNANSTGSYRLNISDANGCTNTFLSNVSASGPDAKTNASVPFCTNTPEYVFTGNGTGFTYQWYKNSVLIPGATNDTLPVTAAGNGSFYVIVNSTCGADTSLSSQNSFTAPPTASITTFSPTSFCPGDSVVLYANNGTNYTYQWSKDGTDIPYFGYYSYPAKATGLYHVTVRNATGCGTLSAGVQVTTFNAPSPVVTANGPTTFCSGNNVLLSTSSTAGALYQWKKNNVDIAGATSFSYTATTTGNYKVKKTNAAGCTGYSSGKQVTVNGLPVATVTPQGPTTFCAGNSVLLKANYNAALSYQWKKNNGNIAGATTHKYTATTAGNYKVKVTNVNGCTKLSNTVTVSVPCREESQGGKTGMDVNINPNPSPGNFNLSVINSNGEILTIDIYDMTGRIMKNVVQQVSPEEYTINGLLNGIYIAEINQGAKRKIIRLVKTN